MAPRRRKSAEDNELNKRDNEMDVDNDMSQPTQATQRTSMAQAETALSNLPLKEQERLVNDLVRYFIIVDQKKYPIRKAVAPAVISRATKLLDDENREKLGSQEKILKKIFGIKLVEIEMGKKQRAFILVNALVSKGENPHLCWSSEESARLGLLTTILSAIFMSNNALQDGELYAMLRTMGVHIEQMHPVFDDVKKLITVEFVREGYLEMIRQPNSEPPAYNFIWGSRAYHETSKMNVLEFVSKVYGTQPTDWRNHYNEALGHLGAASTSASAENILLQTDNNDDDS